MFFHFLKSQIEKYTAMFYLIIGVFTVTQVEACSIISLDHKRIISRVRWNEVPTGPWHIVIHFFTEVCLIRVRQNVVWGGIVKKQNIVQIGVWFGCGIPDLQCQTSVAYKNTEKTPKLVAEIYITQWPFKCSHVNMEIWNQFFPTGLFNLFFFTWESSWHRWWLCRSCANDFCGCQWLDITFSSWNCFDKRYYNEYKYVFKIYF